MTEQALSKDETEEMKALQDLRKGAGNGETVMSDSQRTRLSELQNKAGEAKAEKKEAAAAKPSSGGGAVSK